MNKVGEILKEERLKKGLKLEEVEENTKIRKKYLEAIERGEYVSLGGVAYIFGFVGTYSSFLGLDRKRLEAFLRREIEEEKKEVLPGEIKKEREGFFAGKASTLVMVFVFSLVISLVGFYLFVQSREFLLSPKVKVEKPVEELVTGEEVVEVAGEVGKEVTVFINNQEVEVNSEGKFSQRVNLNIGSNQIEIKGINKTGKETVVIKEVIRE